MSRSYWRAVYRDGSTYTEHDGPYRMIDRQRMVAFELVRDGAVLLGVQMEPGWTLVYRRRHLLAQSGGHAGWHHVVGMVHETGRGVYRYMSNDGQRLPPPACETLVMRDHELGR